MRSFGSLPATVVVAAAAALLGGCFGSPSGTEQAAGRTPDPPVSDLAAEDTGVPHVEEMPGALFELQLIGVRHHGGGNAGESAGNVIFVALDGPTEISLREGEFRVLDADGTDGTAALQLPAPDPDGDGQTAYAVIARALGAPGGTASLTTCLTDATEAVACGDMTATPTRQTGPPERLDISAQALFTHTDLDSTGTAEDHALFADEGLLPHWAYGNDGLRLLQLGFVEVVADPSGI